MATSPDSSVLDPHDAIAGAEFGDSSHANPDLAPTTKAQRKWGVKDIAALWISMSACIPTYMIASSLIAEGMNWWQAVVTIFLGNTIVLMPDDLERARWHQVRHTISPVYCRASFGILGAQRARAPAST